MSENNKPEYIVEHEHVYKGYNYAVVFGSIFHRCGYVGVPEGSPFFGINYNQELPNSDGLKEQLKKEEIGKRGIIPVACWDGETVSPEILFDVHGGITYTRAQENNYPIVTNGNLWWFGFDCGHCDDARDIETAKKYFWEEQWRPLVEIEERFPSRGTIRTLEYVEQECRNLIEQIIQYTSVIYKRRPNANQSN